MNSDDKQELKISFLSVTLHCNKNQRKIFIYLCRVLQITGYESDFIQIDNFEYPPSIILTPNQVMNW